jgi:hypothetical protein
MALNKTNEFVLSKYVNDVIEHYVHLYFTLMFVYENDGLIKQT